MASNDTTRKKRDRNSELWAVVRKLPTDYTDYGGEIKRWSDGKSMSKTQSTIECPYALASDKTAQTEPLTEGQKIVSYWERNLIGEPCELATAIDMALIEAWERGREGV